MYIKGLYDFTLARNLQFQILGTIDSFDHSIIQNRKLMLDSHTTKCIYATTHHISRDIRDCAMVTYIGKEIYI